MKMMLLVMMDGWSLLLPGGVDGPHVGCALLPCEIPWGFLNFQFQDDSDGGDVFSSHHVVLVSIIIVGRCCCHYR